MSPATPYVSEYVSDIDRLLTPSQVEPGDASSNLTVLSGRPFPRGEPRMLRRTHTLGRLAALGAVAAVFAASCGNSTSGSSSVAGPGQSDGVTPTEIDTGALIAETGPLGGVYDGYTHGVKAYFNYINSQGGVNGRTLKLKRIRDDQTDTSRNVAQAQALVNQDHVFAVFASSPVFNGGDFLASKR